MISTNIPLRLVRSEGLQSIRKSFLFPGKPLFSSLKFSSAVRYSSTFQDGPTTTQRKNPKAAKKKVSIQKLRQSDPVFLTESTNYILSLLNDNSSTYSPSKTLEKYLSPVTSITVGESIDFDGLLESIKDLDHTVLIPEEVVNIRSRNKDLMVLSNGTVVGWGISEEVIEDFIPQIESAITKKYAYESDEMDWVELNHLPDNPINNGNSYLQGEILVIQGTSEERKMLEKAAFAIGLSRSTRLSILENTFEEHLQLTKKNSEHLSQGLAVATSESEFLKSTGQLFLLRGKLNLYSELIETPDLYWSEPTLEKIYNSVSKILDINSRISILNRKLDYATEEQRAFLSVLSEKKSTRLEWIIIWLIMVEVAFESFHFYEKYKEKEVASS